MKITFIIFILILAGCATNSGVVPLGDDAYIVTRQKNVSFNGLGKIKTEAMQEAYAQCSKTGKSVEVIRSYQSGPPHIFGNFPRVEIEFKCVQSKKS